MDELVTGDFDLTEGARWVDGRLVFVDILRGRLFEATPDGAHLLAALDVPLGAVAPVRDSPGAWIAAAGTGIARLDASGGVEWLDRPEDTTPHRTRMNDGVCDPAGRFWAGSMAYDEVPGAGSLYRVDHDGTVTRMLDGLTVVNGPAFSPDGRLMYVADSAAGRIYRCEMDALRGEIVAMAEFAAIEAASPDGMTVDDSGQLWSALWDGSAVHCYAPDGALVRVVDVPARRPTSVCIADGRLYVTTASNGLDDPSQTEGAVLCLAVSATAPPAAPFG